MLQIVNNCWFRDQSLFGLIIHHKIPSDLTLSLNILFKYSIFCMTSLCNCPQTYARTHISNHINSGECAFDDCKNLWIDLKSNFGSSLLDCTSLFMCFALCIYIPFVHWIFLSFYLFNSFCMPKYTV